MPPKAKRYDVWVKIPILNNWRVIAYSITKAEATKFMELCQFETRMEEADDD